MNPLAPYLGIIKIVAIFALVGGLIAGYFAWHHHIFEQGVTQEKDRRDKIDAENTIKAQATLAAANEKVRVAQAALTETMAQLSDKQTELHNAQIASNAYQSDLLASRKRLSVLVTTHQSSGAKQTDGTAVASMDQGATFTEDLAPTVARNIEGLRLNENDAITRLNACIAAYEAVERAVNSVSPLSQY